MTATPAILSARGVAHRYGREEVLKGIDLDVFAGSVVALVGNNGAGKSTLLSILTGVLRPTSGAVSRAAGVSIGYMPEACHYYPEMTGERILCYFADLRGIARTEVDRVLEVVGLAAARRKRTRNYSKGMRQRLALAQAMLGSPSLLVLDEPTNGFDPGGIAEFYRIIHSYVEGGAGILLASHQLSEIETHVSSIVILQGGRCGTRGSLSDLIAAANLTTMVTVGTSTASACGQVRAAINGSAIAMEAGGETTLRFRCRPSSVAAAIAQAVGAANGSITSIDVRQPRLEDVFLASHAPAVEAPR